MRIAPRKVPGAPEWAMALLESGLTGGVDSAYSHEIDHIARGDIEPLLRLTHDEIERDGGNGGQEIRNWIALLGAVPGWKGEVLAYEPVEEWIIGCGTVWVHP
jgi:protocatechuate 4,5-dioxygenase beta chain